MRLNRTTLVTALFVVLAVASPAIAQQPEPPPIPPAVKGKMLRLEGTNLIVNTAEADATPAEATVLVDEYTTLRVDGDIAKAADLRPGMDVTASFFQRRISLPNGVYDYSLNINVAATSRGIPGTVLAVEASHLTLKVERENAEPATIDIPIDDNTRVKLTGRLNAGNLGDLRTGTAVVVSPDSGTARTIRVKGAGEDANTPTAPARSASNAIYIINRIEGQLLVLTPNRSRGFDRGGTGEKSINVDENTEFMIDYEPARLEDLRSGMQVNVSEYPAVGGEPLRVHVVGSSRATYGQVVRVEGDRLTISVNRAGQAQPEERTVVVDEHVRFITNVGQRVDALSELRPTTRVTLLPETGNATKILIQYIPQRPAAPTTKPAEESGEPAK